MCKFFYRRGKETGCVYYAEGWTTGECKIEMAQVRARRCDGAQDGAVIVPLLEPERNSERSERGQQTERRAHAHLRALAEYHRIRHAQRLERCARRENLRLHQRPAESGHLGERIFLQVREDGGGGDARGVALEVEGLEVAVRVEEGAEGLA